MAVYAILPAAGKITDSAALVIYPVNVRDVTFQFARCREVELKVKFIYKLILTHICVDTVCRHTSTLRRLGKVDVCLLYTSDAADE